jgi:uncharacterized membrane protein YphA (DoxX/SURF4 family)
VKQTKQELALAALRWALGLVLAGQAATLLLHERAISAFARTGLPPAARLVLAWGEIVAALLFLIPPTLRLGAWCLLAALTGAILLHLAIGSLEIGGLLVDSVAVLVVLVHPATKPE